MVSLTQVVVDADFFIDNLFKYFKMFNIIFIIWSLSGVLRKA